MSNNFFNWMREIGGRFTDFDALQEGFVDTKFNIFYAVKNAFLNEAEQKGLKDEASAVFLTYRAAIRMYEEYRMAGKRAYGGAYKASVEEVHEIFGKTEMLIHSIANDVEQKLISNGLDLEDIRCTVEKMAKCIDNLFHRYVQEGMGKTEQEFIDDLIASKQSKKSSR